MPCITVGSGEWGLKLLSIPVRSTVFPRRGVIGWRSQSPRLVGNGRMKWSSNPTSSASRAAQSIETGSPEAVKEPTNVDKYRLELRNREEIKATKEKFWADFNERHVLYRMERDEWGVGLNPIFRVYENSDGMVYRVDVDETEILMRCGVDPKHPEFADEPCRDLADARVKRAKDLASDIQSGLVTPHPLSTLYQYTREIAGGGTTTRLGGSLEGSFWSMSSSLNSIVPSLAVLLVPIFLLGLGGKWILSRKKKQEDPVAREKRLQLMQLRKLRAQTNREASVEDSHFPTTHVNRDNDVSTADRQGDHTKEQEPKEVIGEVMSVSHSHINNQEFHRKVTEIKAMARKARLQEQENAEARSARTSQNLERKKGLEQEMKERSRSRKLENLAQNLDDVRRLGSEGGDKPELLSKMTISAKDMKPENGLPGISQTLASNSDNVSSTQPGSIDSSAKPSPPIKPGTVSPPAGVKPRIILSADEARASIAAKKARLGANYKSSLKSQVERSKSGDTQPDTDSRGGTSRGETPTSINEVGLRASENKQGMPEMILATNECADDSASFAVGDGGDNVGHTDSYISQKMGLKNDDEHLSESKNINLDHQIEDRLKAPGTEPSGETKKTNGRDEAEEEMEWMRDEVLREIVFKVNANEKAGMDPFHNLNSEQETLFFKGLERKFEREGERVKKWIHDRVENIDYGSAGVNLFDPPESYELKWKDDVETPGKSEVVQQFMKDRERILNEHRGLQYTSPPTVESSPKVSSSDSPISTSPASQVPPIPTEINTVQDKPKEEVGSKSVISSSRRTGKAPPKQATGASKMKSETGKENWDHTKKWSKDLERKYAMETDPAVRGVMREVGQDLERWITEDEIEEATRLLERGEDGEREYAKKHFDKIKEKIKQQRDMFGPEAMLQKYSEYKTEQSEGELWWLSLPYVVCLGLQGTVDGEDQAGLYSVDISPALEGVPGLPTVPYHTVAFQDSGDAQNFCTLIMSHAEKLSAQAAELIPYNPKDLYKETQSEGFKVTVIKKGQLQLSVDQSFEEVEDRIIEIGGSVYLDKLISEREIDMHSVIDEGLGYGRPPQS